ncbi:hypothetical protein POJ06DRAFT_251761 [Lipomyces tetrasporus]|uniref:Uncharacterized protein n=1 Tax=Lipomyces tetrasporus TaxID=54092 RepID=A0AAD7VUR1_9ASCO|nr:uncharacterized protein POJ06DRAFT_251761 [Lipomyces tetrasporus]KAJ8101530.1 hypothetical protein POJ06DRAFT_251761 [Lipomyces tetrasporus]
MNTPTDYFTPPAVSATPHRKMIVLVIDPPNRGSFPYTPLFRDASRTFVKALQSTAALHSPQSVRHQHISPILRSACSPKLLRTSASETVATWHYTRHARTTTVHSVAFSLTDAAHMAAAVQLWQPDAIITRATHTAINDANGIQRIFRVARIFDTKVIVLADGLYNSATRGPSSASVDKVWDAEIRSQSVKYDSLVGISQAIARAWNGDVTYHEHSLQFLPRHHPEWSGVSNSGVLSIVYGSVDYEELDSVHEYLDAFAHRRTRKLAISNLPRESPVPMASRANTADSRESGQNKPAASIGTPEDQKADGVDENNGDATRAEDDNMALTESVAVSSSSTGVNDDRDIHSDQNLVIDLRSDSELAVRENKPVRPVEAEAAISRLGNPIRRLQVEELQWSLQHDMMYCKTPSMPLFYVTTNVRGVGRDSSEIYVRVFGHAGELCVSKMYLMGPCSTDNFSFTLVRLKQIMPASMETSVSNYSNTLLPREPALLKFDVLARAPPIGANPRLSRLWNPFISRGARIIEADDIQPQVAVAVLCRFDRRDSTGAVCLAFDHVFSSLRNGERVSVVLAGGCFRARILVCAMDEPIVLIESSRKLPALVAGEPIALVNGWSSVFAEIGFWSLGRGEKMCVPGSVVAVCDWTDPAG